MDGPFGDGVQTFCPNRRGRKTVLGPSLAQGERLASDATRGAFATGMRALPFVPGLAVSGPLPDAAGRPVSIVEGPRLDPVKKQVQEFQVSICIYVGKISLFARDDKNVPQVNSCHPERSEGPFRGWNRFRLPSPNSPPTH